jgi:hypothetical protein
MPPAHRDHRRTPPTLCNTTTANKQPTNCPIPPVSSWMASTTTPSQDTETPVPTVDDKHTAIPAAEPYSEPSNESSSNLSNTPSHELPPTDPQLTTPALPYKRASIIPPYWHHRRDASFVSIASTRPPPIRLEDHTQEDAADLKSPLWAKAVRIQSHVVVTGGLKGIGIGVGDYVVWVCGVETLDVSRPSFPLAQAGGLICHLLWGCYNGELGGIVSMR